MNNIEETKNKLAEAKKILNRELRKLNNISAEIESYEAIKNIMVDIENGNSLLSYYNEKIKQSYINMEDSIQNINHTRVIIFNLENTINEFERGEKSA